ncbi:MAG: hypothetical protein GWP08_18515 [Nitrospiraceae bacterium]|nr:hypothetical protein [Nitrospiraceae bacterium]
MLTVENLNVQYITDEDGQKQAVIVPIERFNQLLEDIHDLAVIAERKEEPTISHQEVYDILKSDGILSD